MQDIQNIPNPDINSTEHEDDFGNHSDIERENDGDTDTDNIPLPPTEPKPSSIEEPPTDNPKVDEPDRKQSEIV